MRMKIRKEERRENVEGGGRRLRRCVRPAKGMAKVQRARCERDAWREEIRLRSGSPVAVFFEASVHGLIHSAVRHRPPRRHDDALHAVGKPTTKGPLLCR